MCLSGVARDETTLLTEEYRHLQIRKAIEHVERCAIVERIERTHGRHVRRNPVMCQAVLRSGVTARVFARCTELPDLVVFVLERQLEIVARRPQAGQSNGVVILDAERPAGRHIRVARIVELIGTAGEPQPEVVADRSAESEFDARLLIRTILRDDLPLERIAWPAESSRSKGWERMSTDLPCRKSRRRESHHR